MGTELATIEPLQVPDLRKPTAMPSLPAWLTTQRAALEINLQPTDLGFQDLMTLPADKMPSEAQRAMMETHIASLRSCLDQTPANDQERAKETLTTVTKMLWVLGGSKATELVAEAKAEAYMAALEDVPSWAVEAAARRWYRGDCGNDEHGRPYNYQFPPDPAALRRLARAETSRPRVRIIELEEVLKAVPFVDCTEELERGRKAMAGLWHTWREGGGEGLKGLTFDRAVEIGENVKARA